MVRKEAAEKCADGRGISNNQDAATIRPLMTCCFCPRPHRAPPAASHQQARRHPAAVATAGVPPLRRCGSETEGRWLLPETKQFRASARQTKKIKENGCSGAFLQ